MHEFGLGRGRVPHLHGAHIGAPDMLKNLGEDLLKRHDHVANWGAKGQEEIVRTVAKTGEPWITRDRSPPMATS
jgi:hypothetical protein